MRYRILNMATISVRVLFFASAREAAGAASTTVELDDAADTKALR